jgi:cellulose synthase/poly-beta-1,6-N-acetylglucosamine synthase-like glycosyltransferase
MLPIFTLLASIVSVFVSVYAFNMFFLLFLAAKQASKLHTDNDYFHKIDRYPIITIQAPVFNEGRLVERMLENLVSLDYPQDNLQIQVLDDSTDEKSYFNESELIQHYRGIGYNIQLISRKNRRGYKAGALNNGLKFAEGEFVVIIDVDTVLPKDFLKKLIPYFSGKEKLAFIQVRCRYSDRWFNWITESNAVARDVHYLIEQPVKSFHNLMPNFSGQAGIWRKDILEKYEWDEDVLTEDIELSYRVQIDGWSAIYHMNPSVMIELPPYLSTLKIQQRRWTAGFAQTFKKLWKKIIRSKKISIVQKLETFLFLSSPLTHLLVLFDIVLWALAAVFEPKTTLDLWFGNKILSVFLLIMSIGPIFSSIAAIFLSGKDERKMRKILTVPLTLTILTTNIISNASGAVLGLFKKDLIFEKTTKYGVTDNTRGNQLSLDISIRILLKQNFFEILASVFLSVVIIHVLYVGQFFTAIPLSFIMFSWLINIIQK